MKTKNIKSIISTLLVLVLVVGCFTAIPMASAADDVQTIYLKGTGNTFTGTWNNIFELGGARYGDLTANAWHLIFSDKANHDKITLMHLEFANGETFDWDQSMEFSTNNGSNNPGWIIVAPVSWGRLLAGSGGVCESYVEIDIKSTNGQFNISGYNPGTSEKLKKTVDGVPLQEWLSTQDEAVRDDILKGMRFMLYAEDPSNPDDIKTRIANDNAELVAIGTVAVNGEITLAPFGRSFTDMTDEYYWLHEELDITAAKFFEPFDPIRVSITATGDIEIFGNTVATFDKTALYTIWYDNPIKFLAQLRLGGLNGGGEVFPITVVHSVTGATYPSFCANTGSESFAGDPHGYNPGSTDCKGYLVADKSAISNIADFISAYNYIEDKFGSLDDNRIITQVVTWELLGFHIDLDNANLDDGVKADIKLVLANYDGYTGKGTVVDLMYLTCDGGHEDFTYCQPQIVPLYDAVINNKAKAPTGSLEVDPNVSLITITKTIKKVFQREVTPYAKYTRYISPSYGSVTVTTADDYNAKWTVPVYGNGKDKSNIVGYNYGYIVANSNHFTYAKLPYADLAADGVALTLVVGNNIDYVGTGTAVINTDGKLELEFNGDFYNAKFGAVAYTNIPEPKNGNIHSMSEFKHNNAAILDLPAPDKCGFIYLYVHFDTLQYDLGLSTTPTCTWTVDGDYTLKSKKVINVDKQTEPLEITFVVCDAEGNPVAAENFSSLAPGEYTVVFTNTLTEKETKVTAIVEAGKLTTVEYDGPNEEIVHAKPIIVKKYIDNENPVVIVDPAIVVKK